MNPSAIMKLMNAKNKFVSGHPKFSAFLKDIFSRGLPVGTIIEITVTYPGQEPITANMRVNQEDLDLLQGLSALTK